MDSKIKNVLIVGAGLMGRNIAFVTSSCKTYNITVYDVKDVDLVSGIRSGVQKLIDKGVLTEDEFKERLSRIRFITDLHNAGVSDADIVIEAVFENMQIKKETFKNLEAICRPDCFFCTNSSVMSPTEISSDLQYRERFAGTHFWNPGHLIHLVEVVRTDATNDKTVDAVIGFLKSIGKSPCLCKKDVPGFIANRLQHALWREAFSLIDNGIADAATIDSAIKNSFGLRLPQLSVCENADLAGIDLTWQIHDYVLQYLEDGHRPAKCLENMRKRNALGFKTGEGFYKWTDESKEKCSEDLVAYLIKMLYGKE